MTIVSWLEHIDIQTLEIIRSYFSFSGEWFRFIILLVADSEPLLFALFLVVLWCYGIHLGHPGPKHVALDLFWHVMGAFAIYWVINSLLPLRPRPESVTTIAPLINHLPDNSFPSGHALFWGASWWALHTLLDRPRVTKIFFVLGALTCFVRIVAGVHYPGDIVVGFFMGWGIVALLLKLPHGSIYKRYAHDMILGIAKKLHL